MQIFNTGDRVEDVPVFMLLYGSGGIGKSTFASTAPGVFMADCENGSKYFGRRGIRIPIGLIETWADFAGEGGFIDIAIKNPKVKTIVVDPLGELMEKCKRGLIGSGYIDASGQPTLKGWGEVGNRFRAQMRKLRDSGKNVILIAHVEEKDDDGRLVKRPKIQTRVSEDIVNMVDIVAYMETKLDQAGKTVRVITVDPTNDKIVAKDRTGTIPAPYLLPPDFPSVQHAIAGGDIGDADKITDLPTGEVEEKPAAPAAEPATEEQPSFPESTAVENGDATALEQSMDTEPAEGKEDLPKDDKKAAARAKLAAAGKGS